MPEITKIIQNKHAHPVIAEMLHPDVRNDLPLQNVPLPHQKAKAVIRQRRIARSLKRNFSKCLYTLCRLRGIPAADGPTSRPSLTCTCLPVPFNGPTDPWDTYGWFARSGLHCIQW